MPVVEVADAQLIQPGSIGMPGARAGLSSADDSTPVEPIASRVRAIVACNIGNFVELFDFAIYGFFAVAIGRAFFPSSDPLASLLSSFATYGVGFLMRPVGAFVIGAYGDRRGRKAALVLTVGMMALATGLTGLLPTYRQVGVVAPVLLILCRMAQGFSTGGEWGGAAAFLVEHAPPGRRGLIGSLATFGIHIAIGSGSLVGAILNSNLGSEAVLSWGWRLPFLLGFLLGPIGYYLRTRVSETPAFKHIAETSELVSSPIRDTFVLHRGGLVAAFCVSIIGIVGTYGFLVFLPSLAVQKLGFRPAPALFATTLGSVAGTVVIPLAGWLSDFWGRRSLMLTCAIGLAVSAYPLFAFVTTARTIASLIVTQAIASVFLALYSGVIGAMLAEMFPTNVRYTALSIGYGLSIALFGGVTPIALTYLFKVSESPIAPALFVAAAGCASATAAFFIKDRSQEPLR